MVQPWPTVDRAAGVGVHHAEVLEVGVAADDDRLAVTADDRTEPDANPLGEIDPADHRRIGSNPELAFARQEGSRSSSA